MRVADLAEMDKQDVRHMTDPELSELGVEITNRTDLVFQCRKCGEIWEPQLDSSGKLPRDYWVCPMKCNAGTPAL